MKILALDTSSQYASIALTEGRQVVYELTIRGVATQSEYLAPFLRRALEDVGWSPSDLEAFGVVNGPGSFTGIRVGLATVEGLAMAAGKPALGVSSLEALAWGVPPCTLPVCPVLNARRGEFYAALYERRADGLLERMAQRSIPPRELAARLEGEILAVGDAAALLAEVRARLGSPGITHVPDGSAALLRASTVAAWTAATLERLGDEPPPPLRPNYVRETPADLGLRRPARPWEPLAGRNLEGRNPNEPKR